MTENKINSFEDLEVWQVCRQLRQKISRLVKHFPAEEKYRLGDQLVRASRSSCANIAEGFGRFHYQENIQFSRQARGSLYEVLDHLTVALDERYIEQSDYADLKEFILRAIRLVNGYIRHLQHAKTSTK